MSNKYLFFFFLSLIICSPKGFSQIQAQYRIELVSQLSYEVDLNDIWAYVAPDGTEYALVGTTEGVSIVDLSEPLEPEEVAFIPGASSSWRDMKTYREFAYISNETANGINILDLSDLPNAVGSKDVIISNVSTSHNLYVDNGQLFVVGLTSGIFNGGMMVWELEPDPFNPQLVGVYDRTYVHDVFVRDGKAYTAELGRGLTILDISSPEEIELVGNRDYVSAFTHNTWLNDAGTVCFTTDERQGASIRAWDITNPENIVQVDSIQASLSGGASAPHNVHVFNDFLVSSYYRDGIQIVDASRPHNLIEVGFFDTSPDEGAGFSGCWGAYPFLPSGLILATDIQQGLFVLEPEYVRGAYFEGLVLDANTEEPLDQVQIQFIGQDITSFTDEEGNFATGSAESGNFQVVFSRFGYKVDTIEIQLENGVLTEEEIKLTPGDNNPIEIVVIDAISGSPIPDAQVRLGPAFGEFGSVDFFTNQVGLVSSEIVQSQYNVIVGKWGFRTEATILNFDGNEGRITFELQQGFYDDFSLDFGWSTSSNALTGDWVREIPNGTDYFDIPMNPGIDAEGDLGSFAFVTGNTGVDFEDDDVDSGRVILQSPIFDLSNIDNPVLKYRWWFINFIPFTPGNSGNDSLVVQLSNGEEVVTVNAHRDGFANRWIQEEIRIEEFISPTAEMSLIVMTSDNTPDNIVEAGFDVFEIEGEIATSLEPEISDTPSFTLFPIPVEDQLTIKANLSINASASEVTLNIYTITGVLVSSTNWNVNQGLLNIDFPFSHGVYIAEIKSPGREMFHIKFFK